MFWLGFWVFWSWRGTLDSVVDTKSLAGLINVVALNGNYADCTLILKSVSCKSVELKEVVVPRFILKDL